MMTVYECSKCGAWIWGTPTFLLDAPKDSFGRVDRDYADGNSPKFCSGECRDNR